MARIRQAEASGMLPAVAAGPGTWSHAGVLCYTTQDGCVFHARQTGGPSCALETALGSDALPTSCRQFPRVLLTDARGWHQSLSLWCGTAAHIVVSGGHASDARGGEPAEFLSIDHIDVNPRVHVDSLDASDAWPPLLRPGVLAGHGVYERWESRLLQEFFAPMLQGQLSVAHGLGSALCWTDSLRAWRSSEGSLEVLSARPWRHPDRHRLARHPATRSHLESTVLDALLAQVPRQWRPAHWPAGLTDPSSETTPLTRRDGDQALARYLATRLFGSWVAYQGEGLRSILASLASAYAITALALSSQTSTSQTFCQMTNSIRASDWLLLHLLDREQWAIWCRGWEVHPDASPLLDLIAGADVLISALPWAAAPAPHH